eukprot:TRINITY_DN17954_c0_g1_i1.p2 TRINITY_DN17954_c0_g1~~TRINITY_DN17954_c0_g1_i1.p2  ORF type:complete len:126 (+),score=21.86 TRINITY_DN17954_c0_g1_i1:517-894(+)
MQEQPKCRGAFPYEASAEGELSFHLGDVITVLQQVTSPPLYPPPHEGSKPCHHLQDPSGWWQGTLGGQTGWFPANFVELITGEEPPPDETAVKIAALTANAPPPLAHAGPPPMPRIHQYTRTHHA